MTEPLEPGHLSADHTSGSSDEVQFSSFVTLCCSVICLSGFVLLIWNLSDSAGLRDSPTASRDLERLASRLLSVESRIPELSTFEQALFLLWGEEGETQGEVRQWYEEIPPALRYPRDELYAGILDGEADFDDDLFRTLENWDRADPLFHIFRRLLEAAYLEGETKQAEDFRMLQAQVAEEVPANWFYFQIAKRLAEESDDQALRDQLHQQFQQFTDPLLGKWRALVLFELSLGAIGLLCLGYLVCRRFSQLQFSELRDTPTLGSTWTFPEGWAVLVRGGAISIGMIALMVVVPNGLAFLEDYGFLLLYLPTVFMAIFFLRQPAKQLFWKVLGCQKVSQSLRSSFPMLFGAIALGLLGDWVIMLGGKAFQMSVHWTEWFLPQLVWGDQEELIKLVLEIVLIAPIFEEIIFRGILYSTFRAKFTVPISLIGSAAIFALAHGYGVVAFLSVFWSGMLWAWLYERTGSIVPGICAHAINNGLVVMTLAVLFR